MGEPDGEGASVLEATEVDKRFGDVRALRVASLTVHEGELYGLVGPDGAGKTTMLRVVAGLSTIDGGRVSVCGKGFDSKDRTVREAIGYMPQLHGLYGDLSVIENLRFFGRLFGLKRDVFRERVDRLLEITRLSRFADRRADALSGGMYKKLGLACALLHRPRALVLDEPSNGVDPVSRRELWELLHAFVDDGMAVLLATPYMDEAERCHRVGLLHEGRMLAQGAPRELLADFPHQVFRLGSDHARELEEALAGRTDVLALSPLGGELRVVVRGDGVEAFRSWVSEHVDAPIERLKPDFEDAFLAALSEQERHAPEASA